MALTRQQIRHVDRLAIEDLGIPGVVLMENAARGVAESILTLLGAELGLAPAAAKVAVLCGGGNNGGDGYAIARHLHNAGVDVTVYAARATDQLAGDAAVNCEIIRRMGLRLIPITTAGQVASHGPQWSQYDLLVDALLGTGATGVVRQPLATVIEYCNAATAAAGGPKVVAVDVPSGLDCDTGRPATTTVRADLTVTFVAAKIGFEAAAAQPWLGRLVVTGIGAPPQLIRRACNIGR